MADSAMGGISAVLAKWHPGTVTLVHTLGTRLSVLNLLSICFIYDSDLAPAAS